jgi:hypothetical protein
LPPRVNPSSLGDWGLVLSRMSRGRRVLSAGPALLLVLIAAPAFAQSEPTGISIAYERARDRVHYRFENPSSLGTEELIPHEFTQTYWGDNQWVVVRAAFKAGSRLLETEAGATPQRRHAR